jgi:hypothetical protein
MTRNMDDLNEPTKIAKLTALLADALDHPLTSPGSEQLAALVLQESGSKEELLAAFASKCLQTLDDGTPHSVVVVSPRQDFVTSFVAWNGTHQEVQPERIGNYLGSLYGTAKRFVQMGLQPLGFLEIDAYVREASNISVNVEYSYLPNFFFGGTAEIDDPRLRVALINTGLCTTEEQHLLRQLTAKLS